MSEPNYNETTAEGTKWQRCCKVIIENPINGLPSIYIQEEIAVNIGEQTLTQNCGGLSEVFKSDNLLHVEIYTKLNELYVLLRTARDDSAVLAALPPVEPPAEG